MATLPLAHFVERLCRSQLLETERQEEVRGLQAKYTEARDLAQELLHRDWLTAYQVNQLFQDRGDALVLGQYVLLERLGEGGMGQVFKARQRNLHRVVALKIIRRDCLDNPKVIQRFQREIRAAGQLSHANIIHAYDADEVNGTYYIAMELIDGIDLALLVKEGGPLQVAQACDYIRQAALGLQHAHECGMVHRDIKPANLLVTRASEKRKGSAALARPNSAQLARPGSALLKRPGSAVLKRPATGERWGTVKILDMGLARLTDPDTGLAAGNLTQMGTVMGTPDFIAPEQAANSRTCDIRADIYSLGCTLYYLLSGQAPFPEGTILDKLIRHQKDDPTPVEKTRRARLACADQTEVDADRFHVPGEVEAVLHKMLAKHPRDRFQTPGELAETLVGVLERLADGPPDIVKNEEKTVIETRPAPVSPQALTADQIILLTPTRPAPRFALPKFARLPRKWATLATVAGALFLGMVLAQVGKGKPRANPPADNNTPGVKTEPIEEVLWKKLANKAKLPSAFDALERRKIDKKEWFEWQPKEVVGVLGSWKMLNDSKNPAAKYNHALAISPDGRYVVSGGPHGLLRSWDMTTHLEHKVMGHSKQIFRIAFAPDGRTFATASFDGTTKLWDARNRDLLYTLDKADREGTAGRSKNMSSVVFSPDGTTLASAGAEGIIRFWDTSSGAAKTSLHGKFGNITALTLTPDGKDLFWAEEGGLVRWSRLGAGTVDKSHQFRTSPGMIKTLAISPDGQTLVVGDPRDGGLRLCSWNGVTLKETKALHGHLGFVHGVAFAPDGKTFVSVSEDKTVKLWDARTGQAKQSWELRWPIVNVAFTPDGRHFLTANSNSTVYIFRPGTGSGEAVAAR